MFAQCIPLESESETKPLVDSILNEMLVLKLFLYGLLNNTPYRPELPHNAVELPNPAKNLRDVFT